MERRSGDRLRDWMGVDRDAFYESGSTIVPMDFYFPGAETATWHPQDTP